MRHAFRLFWTGWVFNVKNLTMSGFFILNATISPIFFATIAHYMFAGGTRPGSGLLYASLGAGMMGIWSSVLFGSGGLIQWQRWQGTLEYVIGVPPRLIQVVLPMTVATASIGLYSIASTLLWGRVIFGFLLIFTGANVPISELPGWMQDVSHVLPLTHAIQAARDLAAGEPFSDVTGLLATELGLGLTYLAGGLVLLRVFEWQGRKHATLEQL